MPQAPAETATTPCHVTRIEVRPRDSAAVADATDGALLERARQALGEAVTGLQLATVYLIESGLDAEQTARVADELLADPVTERAIVASSAVRAKSVCVEVHYLPGVMDPVAQSAEDAIAEMFAGVPGVEGISVRTGTRYDVLHDGSLSPVAVEAFAAAELANAVVQSIHLGPYHPASFNHGRPYELDLKHIPLLGLDDAGLERLSREGHLFLSLDEMQTIQRYYRDLPGGGREPTDIELETLAQTWSEHCVHKTLKSTIRYRGRGAEGPRGRGGTGNDALAIFRNKPGHEVHEDGSVTIQNLLRSTVAAATFTLRDRWKGTDREGWLVSVFDDNAGIVKFDETHGIAIKVETHNHPSALEPYGGAATGIGGCIRDIMGTGLVAKPIANTDTFCVGVPAEIRDGETERRSGKTAGSDNAPSLRLSISPSLPPGVIPPRRTLERVVDGVRDYGNRMGIPTVDGAVYFDDDYVANPLVFAGCVGLIPLDRCFGEAKPGDRIIILGGETGRDGIHGATFSSAELTDTHAEEFSHAVQIGNAITEKKVLDVLLQARDHVDPAHPEDGVRPLFHAISDCGAGGFSSAVGEMAEKVGARVTLDTAPLKYQGLTYTEVWISEAQERMPLAVPPENVDALRALCEAEDVPICDLGEFGYEAGGRPTLSLTWHGTEVGRLDMAFMHDGLPMPTREAVWPGAGRHEGTKARRHEAQGTSGPPLRASVPPCLRALLSHPNIASKHWIIRQYDHEVQGRSVVKPLVGPEQDGPSDAAVLRPKPDSMRGIVLSNGLAPHLSEKATARGLALDGDSYQATLHALDEAVRNAVCVGADPRHLAILDNFCWPRCDDPAQLGSLVRAAEACYDGALAYETPFVSGKDSLSNQFNAEDGRLITIPPTLLISALGMMDDVTRAVTMDAKAAGDVLFIVGTTGPRLGGSHLVACGLAGEGADRRIPRVDLQAGPANAAAVAALIRQRLVAAAHDCSDGGLLVAAAEMAFAGRVGLDLDLNALPVEGDVDLHARCFAESPSRYLLEVGPDDVDAVTDSLRDAGVPHARIGVFGEHQNLTLNDPDAGHLMSETLDALREMWMRPLDW